MADVHRLAEIGVALALAALEDDDARVLVCGAVELGQAPGGDRAAEAGADDADVHPLRHYGSEPFLVRPRFSFIR